MAGSKEPQLTMLIALVLGLSVLALAVAWGLRGFVLRQDNGTPEMRKISDAIQEGAQAFLRRQYRTIGLLSIALGVLIYLLYAFFRKPHPGEPAAATLALTTTLSFLFGALCSGVAGLVGMYVAVRSNIRTASAARSSLNKALQIALRGGAVTGLFAVANPGVFSPAQVVGLMLFPLVARAFGLVASIIGVLVVKAREDEDPMHALNRGYMWTAVLAALGFVGGTYWLLNPAGHPVAWWHFALCGVIGIATSIAFVNITQYYTEYRYRPVKSIAAASVTGPATLAAFLLFSADLDEMAPLGSPLQAVDITKPEVFVGGLLGAMLVCWFSALAIGAVTKAAVSVIKEVRRQFQAAPGILKGTSRPDYGTAVDIVTIGALKAMVAPGLLAVAMPIAVGLLLELFQLGAETVAAFLMVGTIGGILMALLLNNGGGAWANAKKFIETGEYGGKGSPTHKAAVVGDTVGDPFKDTAGPSLHVLIKLLSTVTLVLAPLFV